MSKKSGLTEPKVLSVDDEDLISLESNESEDDIDEKQHSKLLNAIASLDGKKKLRVLQRTEPVAKISEHALAEVRSKELSGGKGKKVKVEDLLQAIAEKPKLKALKTAVKQSKKHARTLEAPLEKPQALRIERAAGYEKVKDEISKWDDVVKGNRLAEQIVFPLNQTSVKLQNAKEFTAKLKPKTPLEKEISDLLRGNKYVQQENQELTPAEHEALKSMSLKEALERRKELARMKALQSYQETKARRQNKIKSKTYHRLLKKEKMKNHLKEFEALKELDPEAALEKLEQLEKKRVEERMTLKHKGAGKWAKLQAIRAKYDENAREALADQLRIGKEITRKVKKDDDVSDDEVPVIVPEVTDNPWLGGGAKQSDTTQEITSGYRKLWNTLNASKEKRKELETSSESPEITASTSGEQRPHAVGKPRDASLLQSESEDDSDDDVSNDESEEDNVLNAPEMQNDFSEELEEGVERQKRDYEMVNIGGSSKPSRGRVGNIQSKWNVTDISKGKSIKVTNHKQPANTQQHNRNEAKKVANIDPNKYVTMENAVTLKSSTVSTEEGADEQDEEEEAAALRRMTLAEAFADDDVVDQFKEEKKRVVDASAPKDIDLTLPGWGEWGGSGLKISRRKKKLFIIKAPPAPKRKDENMGHLIINDDQCAAMRKQRVNDLPFPFRSAAAFESSIRAPVTSTFIPESASRKLTAPKVITKMGAIITPMSEDVIIATAQRNGKEEDEKPVKEKHGKGDLRKRKRDTGSQKPHHPRPKSFKKK